MFIVEFRSKGFGGKSWHGEPGNCMNGAGFRPSRSAIFRKDAVRFVSRTHARRAAKDCNDQWTGHVIEVEPEHGGAIVTRGRKCFECGEQPEQDYITGERHPILIREVGECGRCARCFYQERLIKVGEQCVPDFPIDTDPESDGHNRCVEHPRGQSDESLRDPDCNGCYPE